MDVDRRLAYLENMSCIGVPHPDFKFNLSKLPRAVVDCETLLEERFVKIYTFQEVLDLHNAHGCEVLIIDAEGADCAILRSMIVASSSSRFVWRMVAHVKSLLRADSYMVPLYQRRLPAPAHIASSLSAFAACVLRFFNMCPFSAVAERSTDLDLTG